VSLLPGQPHLAHVERQPLVWLCVCVSVCVTMCWPATGSLSPSLGPRVQLSTGQPFFKGQLAESSFGLQNRLQVGHCLGETAGIKVIYGVFTVCQVLF
jgi:hypothetical protein